jgi:hypothetical protein
MPIALLAEHPGGNAEMYEAVSAKVGMDDGLPEGLIVHTAAPMDGGGWRIFDVWESREALEDFEHDLLIAAHRV